MADLLELNDDELLLVLTCLRFWDLINLKSSCKRANVLVPSYLRRQEVLDFSLPLPREQEAIDSLFVRIRSLVLGTVGPNLKQLIFGKSYEEHLLFEDEQFVVELAKQCPKLKCLPIYDHRILLRFCEISGNSVEDLNLNSKHKGFTSVEHKVKLLELCGSIKRLEFSVARSGSISWILDIMNSRPNCLESISLAYDSLTPQLSQEILALVTASPRLTEINLRNCGYCLNDTKEAEMNENLLLKLRHLKRFSTNVDVYDIEETTLGPFVTSLFVNLYDGVIDSGFLLDFTNLTELTIMHRQAVHLMRLDKTVPKTVTSLRTNCLDEVHLEQMETLMEQRGSQFEHLDITFESRESQKLLVNIVDHCCNLKSLVLQSCGWSPEFPDGDLSAQLESLCARLTTLQVLTLHGIHISQEAFETCLKQCAQLESIQVLVENADYDANKLISLLRCRSKLYEAKVELIKSGSDGIVYHYLNGVLIRHEDRKFSDERMCLWAETF
ncbi:hypothetical protein HDE_00967 [Halotydeus destructor]|nr:hypothetical protein HDE_00967 [Halotydeus destructor]